MDRDGRRGSGRSSGARSRRRSTVGLPGSGACPAQWRRSGRDGRPENVKRSRCPQVRRRRRRWPHRGGSPRSWRGWGGGGGGLGPGRGGGGCGGVPGAWWRWLWWRGCRLRDCLWTGARRCCQTRLLLMSGLRLTGCGSRRLRAGSKTLTWDQGSEMARWAEVEQGCGIEVFFCEPRCPWQ